MTSVVHFIQILLEIYIICVLLWVLVGWLTMLSPKLAWNPAVSTLRRFLDSVIEPLLRPIRRLLPPVRMGGGFLDLSPIVLIIGIYILQAIIGSVA